MNDLMPTNSRIGTLILAHTMHVQTTNRRRKARPPVQALDGCMVCPTAQQILASGQGQLSLQVGMGAQDECISSELSV